MKNFLLICTHLGSSSEQLIDSLNQNDRILIRNLQLTYEHPEILQYIFSLEHKVDNSAAIYGDRNLYDKDFCCKAFYKFTKFIYLIRSAKDSLNEILFNVKGMDELRATRYYCFRLRRLYEMAYATPGSVLLTYDNIISGVGMNLIEDYLELPTPISFSSIVPMPPIDLNISLKSINIAQDCYEKYLFRFKNLNLRIF